MSRIAGVSTFLLTAPGRHIGMPDTQRSAALIQITTDDGATGLGETYAGLYVAPVVPSLVEVYRPLLLGSDPDEIGPLLDTMRLRSMRWGMVGLPVQVMSGIEMALWDLYAKRRDVPAYRVLGRMAQPRLRLYASAYAAPHPPQATAAKVAHYAAAGFTAVKLATGFWDHPRDASTPLARIIEEERAKLDAIRREVGGGVDIALDHHGANNPHPWSGETAAEIIGALDDYGLMWIEQPCASHDVAGYARLRAKVRTPVAGAEDATTLYEIARYLDAGALDVIQPDVAWMGIAATREAFALARAHGVRTTLHVAGTAVARAANYHFALTEPDCAIVEYQVEQNPLFDELLVEPFDVRGGHLHPPAAPGFGVKVTPEVLSRYPFVARAWRPTKTPGGSAQGRT
jgi:L-alanine-DL-glutamate epimerase-like enolase superfamily enzyme